MRIAICLLLAGALSACATKHCSLSDYASPTKYIHGKRPAFTLPEAVAGNAQLKGKAVALILRNGELAEGIVTQWDQAAVSLAYGGVILRFPAEDITKLRRADRPNSCYSHDALPHIPTVFSPT